MWTCPIILKRRKGAGEKDTPAWTDYCAGLNTTKDQRQELERVD